MLAIAVEDLPLSLRQQALCKRAHLKDATQILTAAGDNLQTFHGLIGEEGAAHVRRVAALAQAAPLSSLGDVCRAQNLLEGHTVDDGSLPHHDEPISSPVVADEAFSGGSQHAVRHAVSTSSRLPPSVLSTGDSGIDRILGGGMHAGMINEITGRSATGKTQIALQTAVYAALALTPLPSEEEAAGMVQQRPEEDDADVIDALQGIGIGSADARISAALLSPDGHGEAQRMTRRMLEMCDALVSERWHIAQRADVVARREIREAEAADKHASDEQAKQRKRLRRAGWFASDERQRYALQDAQGIARKQLLANVHIAPHGDLESLLHAIVYFLPGLASSLAQRGLPRLGLIVVDDLPTVINEALEASASDRLHGAVARSRIVCDLTDRLKRAAVICGRLAASQSHGIGIPAAIVAINHVADASDREKEILAPIVERALQEAAPRSAPTCNPAASDRHATTSVEAPLTSALQELHFSGLLAHLDPTAIWHARSQLMGVSNSTRTNTGDQLVPTREEAVAGIVSTLRTASLGYTWVNCISSRLVLVRSANGVTLPQRILWPHAPRKRALHEGDSHAQGLSDTEAVAFYGGREQGRPARRAMRVGIRRAVSVLSPCAVSGNGREPGVDFVIVPAGVRALSALHAMHASCDARGEDVTGETVGSVPHGSATQLSRAASPSALSSDSFDLAADQLVASFDAEHVSHDADLWSSVDDVSALDDLQLTQAIDAHEHRPAHSSTTVM